MGNRLATNEERYLVTLQRLLAIPAADLENALSHASDTLADALKADKVDAFLYDGTKDSLVAVGTSNQPLSALQRSLGLDVLQVSNGGRVVYVYQTGKTYVTGRLQDDPEELRGVKEGMHIQSKLGVPLEIAGTRRGMVMIASLKPDWFSESDVRFAETAVRWVAMVAHRGELVREIEKNAVEQAHKAVAEKLITMLAHDLRNYLAPVLLRLHHIATRAKDGPDKTIPEYAAASIRGLGRISSLVDNILDVARLDQGLFELDIKPVDMAKLLEDSARALESPRHRIIVKVSQAILLNGDEGRLRQVIDNLLSNAVKHSPNDAPVSVFAEIRKEDGHDYARIEVVDEGPGVPEDLLPHIFERYTSGRGHEGGLGLGLYIAKRIAVAHGGELEVSTEAGRGAKFALTLPLGDREVL
jgi:two-component system, OmpR family, sensor kinase